MGNVNPGFDDPGPDDDEGIDPLVMPELVATIVLVLPIPPNPAGEILRPYIEEPIPSCAGWFAASSSIGWLPIGLELADERGGGRRKASKDVG